jgi:curved DNA-binding protein CbpA
LPPSDLRIFTTQKANVKLSGAKETTNPVWFGSIEKNRPPAELSAYFLELSSLLDRVESSTTHYQVLGLNRSATRKDVDASYREALSLMYPEYGVGAVLPADVVARIDKAFRKASLAFSVLGSFANRRSYEPGDVTRLEKTPSAAAPNGSPGNTGSYDPAGESRSPDRGDENVIAVSQNSRARVYSEFGRTASTDNRRRSERVRLSIPARVTGSDRKTGKWNEMTETVDVGRTGITIRMRRRVQPGGVLYLTLPLPTKLRSHGYSDPHYSVYTLIRRVEPPHDGAWEVSLEFLGEHPPPGFLDKPWAVFRTKRPDGSERRRSPRISRRERVRIEYLSEPLHVVALEEALTENVSRTGLRITVKAAPVDFDMVRVISAIHGFNALAAVRNRFVAKDGIVRLCVQFLDAEWPV